MKYFLLLLLILPLGFKSQNMQQFREILGKAVNSETAAKKLLASSEKKYSETKQPIFTAYNAVANFMMAKHSSNVISKLSYFKKGKKLLDGAVTADPKNIEIRFLRYTCQDNIPAVLGYKNNMAEDKNMIKQYYLQSKDKELISNIKQYFNW